MAHGTDQCDGHVSLCPQIVNNTTVMTTSANYATSCSQLVSFANTVSLSPYLFSFVIIALSSCRIFPILGRTIWVFSFCVEADRCDCALLMPRAASGTSEREENSHVHRPLSFWVWLTADSLASIIQYIMPFVLQR